MSKKLNFRFLLLLVAGIFLSLNVVAQTITVKGHVQDTDGHPVVFASVTSVNPKALTNTDAAGNFTIKAQQGSKLRVSYIGYKSADVVAAPTVTVVLEDNSTLNEAVVIGYGVAKKSDVTGSVMSIKPDSKNKGLVVNPQDLIQGKVAGVSVTSGGGTPGGGATIRIRGGSSLNASNDPLIVIDGVAMDNQGVKGLANPLSMVNPQDIESFNILKDASATAIYGSRGSNGVIIITTKKGARGQAPKISYAGSVTMSTKKKTLKVMNGDEFRAFVKKYYGETSEPAQALGTANTDWQKEIYRTAWSHDHNVTLSGSLKWMPYRVSLGYTDQQGILKTSDFRRYTAALNLSPSFLDDHLTMNLSAKGMYAESQYANGSAVGAALWMDPTQSIYDTKSADAANFHNYFQWRTTGASLGDPTWPNAWNNLATANPVALLKLMDDKARSRSFIGNAEFNYKVHGFEDLRLHMNLGADVSQGKQTTIKPAGYPSEDGRQTYYYGYNGWDKILKRNLSFNAYAQYYKDLNDSHHFDVMAGYEWQHFWRSQHSLTWGKYPTTNPNYATLQAKQVAEGLIAAGEAPIYNLSPYDYKTENYLVSFFGRANYSYKDRYLFTATLRDDGSSRFKDHWALFPSFAFAWKAKNEPFLTNVEKISDLKLRLGYGQTGQQEGIGDYNYFAVYGINKGTSSFYPITRRDGKPYGVLNRPDAYDPNLKWETTTTYNAGVDLGFLNNRLTASIDYYYRKTTDLLNRAYVAAGTNFKNTVMTNIGSLKNTGFELALDYKAIQTDDWFWDINLNATYNQNKITELIGGDKNYYVAVGGISAGTGFNAQAHTVGKPAFSYYVYQQVYGKDGKPISGVVVDRNGDGQITEADKYFYKSPMAPWTFGLSSRLSYKQWDLSFTLRANVGNYVYNNYDAASSDLSAVWSSSKFLSNRPLESINRGWASTEEHAVLSDHFVQNGSFLKCDNITLGYNFTNLFCMRHYSGLGGRIYLAASNVFTITKYKGIDPEVFKTGLGATPGIDSDIYPRPFSLTLGLNLNF